MRRFALLKACRGWMRRGPLPNSLFIEVTGLCNLRCKMCHRNHIVEELGEMKMHTFMEAAKLFPFVDSVSLMGIGEPLTNKNLLTMITVCRSHGLTVGFNSNGLLLTPGSIKDLILSGLGNFVFSVDGASREVYERIRIGSDFDRVIENIRKFVAMKKELGREGPVLSMEFVATTENIHELLPYIDLAKDLGIDTIVVAHLSEFSEYQAREALYNYRDSGHECIWREAMSKARSLGLDLVLPPLKPVEDSSCGFKPWERSFVSWKGDIRPCCGYLHAKTLHYGGETVTVPRMSFGNIHEGRILDFWYSPGYIRFREDILNKKYTKVCNSCLYSKRLIPAS